MARYSRCSIFLTITIASFSDLHLRELVAPVRALCALLQVFTGNCENRFLSDWNPDENFVAEVCLSTL